MLPLKTEWDEAAWSALSPRAREVFADLYDDWRAALTAVVGAIDAEYRLSDDRHLVDLSDDGWIIQHPMACRPNLFACPFNREMAGHNLDDDTPPGRYVGLLIEDRYGSKILNLGDRVDA